MTTTPTSGAADLLTLIEAYAEARHRQGHSSYNTQTAAALQAVKDALAAGQATAAQQGVAYAALPEPYCNAHDDAGACYPDMFSEHQMRAFADATHTLRASHGQAPAQPDQPIACSYGDNGYACCEGGPCQADVHNDKLAEQPAPAGAVLPAGWVPLTITLEGQFSEEVAYGPQIMMDRLGKWLGKYFAQAADSVTAVSDLPPLPAPDLRDVGTKPQEIKEYLKGYATEYARTAIAARAPADSVLEDAHALLQDVAACFTRDDDLPNNLLPRIDAVLAARKQGANQ